MRLPVGQLVKSMKTESHRDHFLVGSAHRKVRRFVAAVVLCSLFGCAQVQVLHVNQELRRKKPDCYLHVLSAFPADKPYIEVATLQGSGAEDVASYISGAKKLACQLGGDGLVMGTGHSQTAVIGNQYGITSASSLQQIFSVIQYKREPSAIQPKD